MYAGNHEKLRGGDEKVKILSLSNFESLPISKVGDTCFHLCLLNGTYASGDLSK